MDDTTRLAFSAAFEAIDARTLLEKELRATVIPAIRTLTSTGSSDRISTASVEALRRWLEDHTAAASSSTSSVTLFGNAEEAGGSSSLSGWLRKLSSSGLTTHRRWVVLDGSTLCYYKDASERELKGVLRLQTAQTTRLSGRSAAVSAAMGRGYPFSVEDLHGDDAAAAAAAATAGTGSSSSSGGPSSRVLSQRLGVSFGSLFSKGQSTEPARGSSNSTASSSSGSSGANTNSNTDNAAVASTSLPPGTTGGTNFNLSSSSGGGGGGLVDPLNPLHTSKRSYTWLCDTEAERDKWVLALTRAGARATGETTAQLWARRFSSAESRAAYMALLQGFAASCRGGGVPSGGAGSVLGGSGGGCIVVSADWVRMQMVVSSRRGAASSGVSSTSAASLGHSFAQLTGSATLPAQGLHFHQQQHHLSSTGAPSTSSSLSSRHSMHLPGSSTGAGTANTNNTSSLGNAGSPTLLSRMGFGSLHRNSGVAAAAAAAAARQPVISSQPGFPTSILSSSSQPPPAFTSGGGSFNSTDAATTTSSGSGDQLQLRSEHSAVLHAGAVDDFHKFSVNGRSTSAAPLTTGAISTGSSSSGIGASGAISTGSSSYASSGGVSGSGSGSGGARLHTGTAIATPDWDSLTKASNGNASTSNTSANISSTSGVGGSPPYTVVPAAAAAAAYTATSSSSAAAAASSSTYSAASASMASTNRKLMRVLKRKEAKANEAKRAAMVAAGIGPSTSSGGGGGGNSNASLVAAVASRKAAAAEAFHEHVKSAFASAEAAVARRRAGHAPGDRVSLLQLAKDTQRDALVFGGRRAVVSSSSVFSRQHGSAGGIERLHSSGGGSGGGGGSTSTLEASAVALIAALAMHVTRMLRIALGLLPPCGHDPQQLQLRTAAGGLHHPAHQAQHGHHAQLQQLGTAAALPLPCAPPDFESRLLELCREALLCSSRTVAGGDTYDLLEFVFRNAERVILVPDTHVPPAAAAAVPLQQPQPQLAPLAGGGVALVSSNSDVSAAGEGETMLETQWGSPAPSSSAPLNSARDATSTSVENNSYSATMHTHAPTSPSPIAGVVRASPQSPTSTYGGGAGVRGPTPASPTSTYIAPPARAHPTSTSILGGRSVDPVSFTVMLNGREYLDPMGRDDDEVEVEHLSLRESSQHHHRYEVEVGERHHGSGGGHSSGSSSSEEAATGESASSSSSSTSGSVSEEDDEADRKHGHHRLQQQHEVDRGHVLVDQLQLPQQRKELPPGRVCPYCGGYFISNRVAAAAAAPTITTDPSISSPSPPLAAGAAAAGSASGMRSSGGAASRRDPASSSSRTVLAASSGSGSSTSGGSSHAAASYDDASATIVAPVRDATNQLEVSSGGGGPVLPSQLQLGSVAPVVFTSSQRRLPQNTGPIRRQMSASMLALQQQTPSPPASLSAVTSSASAAAAGSVAQQQQPQWTPPRPERGVSQADPSTAAAEGNASLPSSFQSSASLPLLGDSLLPLEHTSEAAVSAHRRPSTSTSPSDDRRRSHEGATSTSKDERSHEGRSFDDHTVAIAVTAATAAGGGGGIRGSKSLLLPALTAAAVSGVIDAADSDDDDDESARGSGEEEMLEAHDEETISTSVVLEEGGVRTSMGVAGAAGAMMEEREGRTSSTSAGAMEVHEEADNEEDDGDDGADFYVDKDGVGQGPEITSTCAALAPPPTSTSAVNGSTKSSHRRWASSPSQLLSSSGSTSIGADDATAAAGGGGHALNTSTGSGSSAVIASSLSTSTNSSSLSAAATAAAAAILAGAAGAPAAVAGAPLGNAQLVNQVKVDDEKCPVRGRGSGSHRLSVSSSAVDGATSTWARDRAATAPLLSAVEVEVGPSTTSSGGAASAGESAAPHSPQLLHRHPPSPQAQLQLQHADQQQHALQHPQQQQQQQALPAHTWKPRTSLQSNASIAAHSHSSPSLHPITPVEVFELLSTLQIRVSTAMRYRIVSLDDEDEEEDDDAVAAAAAAAAASSSSSRPWRAGELAVVVAQFSRTFAWRASTHPSAVISLDCAVPPPPGLYSRANSFVSVNTTS